MSTAPPCGQSVYSSRCPYLIRMMTEGVWAMAPIMLHTQITQRKVRKACWQPGLGHFPGKATASSLVLDIHVQLVRFWNRDKKWEWIWRSNRTAALYVCIFVSQFELSSVWVSGDVYTHWFGAASEAGWEVGDSIGTTDGAHWCCVAVTVTDARRLGSLPGQQRPTEEVKGRVREYMIWFGIWLHRKLYRLNIQPLYSNGTM